VLVVDNDAEMLALLRRHLEAEGLAVLTAASGPEAVAALESQDVDVVLTDLIMDQVDGLGVLAAAQRLRPGARVLLMTAFGSLETAIEAMRQGAHDYLTKPFKLAQVSLAVRRALDDRRLRQENERLRAEVERQLGLQRILGTSRAIRAVLDQVRAVADSDAAVLLLGESGTGKELVARALHWSSARRAGPFVPVRRGPSPAPTAGAPASSPRPRAGPCSWTRWATCPRPCRPKSSGPSRTRPCAPSAAPSTSCWTSGW